MAEFNPYQAKQPLVQGYAMSDADMAKSNNEQIYNNNQMAQPPFPIQQQQQQQQQFYQYPSANQQQFQQNPPDQQYQYPIQNQQQQQYFSQQQQPIPVQPQVIYVQQQQNPIVSLINVPTNCDGQINSARVFCGSCQKEVYTTVQRDITSFQIICVIFLIFCFWPLFWIPFVSQDCYDFTHYCPNCRKVLGRRQRT